MMHCVEWLDMIPVSFWKLQRIVDTEHDSAHIVDQTIYGRPCNVHQRDAD